jgi:hypothetical protein
MGDAMDRHHLLHKLDSCLPSFPIHGGLRVGFYSERLARSNVGGGEVQLLKTAEFMRRRGVEVEICNRGSIGRRFDLVHIFGTTLDGLEAARTASAVGVPIALSTISWYDPWVNWHLEPTLWRRVRGVAGWGIRRTVPCVPSWRRELMDLSSVLLPNSQAEASQLQRLFSVPDSKVAIVPNAVDPTFADGDARLFE